MEHAVVRAEGRSQEIFERFLDRRKIHRKIVLYTPHFLSLPMIPRQDAAVAALFSSLLFELAKQVFVAYLAEFGRFLELYGSFTNLVVVAFWVYYSSIVFILGGELARIVQVQRGRGSRPGWSFREVSP